jgi:carbamoylphosphate synthase large subunit
LSSFCCPVALRQATIMTDPGMADATYVGPMTPELVEQILDKVSRHSYLMIMMIMMLLVKTMCLFAVFAAC